MNGIYIMNCHSQVQFRVYHLCSDCCIKYTLRTSNNQQRLIEFSVKFV